MTSVGGIAGGVLRSFVDRIERLEGEKKNMTDDIKDVYAEAKSSGFDVKIMRKIIQLRTLDENERLNQEAITDLYIRALGMTSND